MHYTNIIMEGIVAIIPVAGLSSRMGSFKPLLPLNGFAMIELTLQSVLYGGAEQVAFVTGRDAEEVEAVLSSRDTSAPSVKGLSAAPHLLPPQVTFVHNKDYASTDMLASIKLGLDALLGADSAEGDSAKASAAGASAAEADVAESDSAKSTSIEAALVIPGDIPGVSPRSIASMLRAWKTSHAGVLVPTYKGTRGHPILISKECFDAVMDFSGDGGLKQALAGQTWQELEVDDEGILLDADTPESFAQLKTYIERTRGVSREIAEELFLRYETPSHIHDHTNAVATTAQRMALQLNQLGYGLDVELCRSAGELHDVNRLEPKHSQVAADNLQALGYEAIAHIVREHDRELRLSPEMFTETNLVFLADKLIKESTLVSIEHRYEGAFKHFPPSTPIGKMIQRDSGSARVLLAEYVRLTGDDALTKGTIEIRRRDHAET